MKVLIVIPSRYASTRFEGKPLAVIAGKSLVRRTYEQACSANLDAKVVVATDDQRIMDHVSGFGHCIMTSPDHVSGTDRCFEAASKLGEDFEVLINLQGDEPFIRPEQIEALAGCFKDAETDIATLRKPVRNKDELFNPNVVSVVCRQDGTALYFSRHPIPYLRGVPEDEWHLHHPFHRHVGMYAFRKTVIDKLQHLAHGKLEAAESLEQLRWLENGFSIRVADTGYMSPAVDSPDDLIAVDNFLKINPHLI